MRLVPIPEEKYEEYRLNLMFDCYKWDPQFLDHNTVAKYALVITEEEYQELARLTENLDKETRAAEEFLNMHLECAQNLQLTKKLKKEVQMMKNYDATKHVRLMRYDFHPTVDGKWAISEVNSDVPGGFAEGSLMPQTAMNILNDDNYYFKSFSEVLIAAIANKIPSGGRIAMVHCTCYSDDRQVMQFLGEQLEQKGFSVIYMAADHLRFEGTKAYSLLDGNEGPVDAIVRFTPLEWLTEMKTKNWQGYFNTTTLCCNHPVAIFAQTKRFPFVWDVLEKNGISMSTWRALLPDTLEIKDVKDKEGYIYKPVYGRVGENISIKEACEKEEYEKILKDVRQHPKKYIAQKRFESKALLGENGREYHVCLGSYTVDGKHAGFYARISDTPRVDSNAADIPVLIESVGMQNIENKTDSSFPTLETHKINKRIRGREVYKIWAPADKKWVDWVRPVPFVELKTQTKAYEVSDLTIPVLCGIEEYEKNAAILVDLPDVESVKAGLALAKIGYRPIPIYNGTIEQRGARATTDNQSVGIGLQWGAKALEEMTLKEDASPAFLVDSGRLSRFKLTESVFDNSWDVYPQDLPSGNYFRNNGIEKIIVIGTSISRDLKKLLYDYQRKSVEIYFTNGYEHPKKVIIPKESWKEKLRSKEN